VSNKKIHKDFLRGEELPANILPAGIGWKDMQQRLEDEMPETIVPPAATLPDRSFLKRLTRGVLLLLLLFIAWTFASKLEKQNARNISGNTRIKSNPRYDENKAGANEQNSGLPKDNKIKKEDKKDQVINDFNTERENDKNKKTNSPAPEKKKSSHIPVSAAGNRNNIAGYRKHNRTRPGNGNAVKQNRFKNGIVKNKVSPKNRKGVYHNDQPAHSHLPVSDTKNNIIGNETSQEKGITPYPVRTHFFNTPSIKNKQQESSSTDNTRIIVEPNHWQLQTGLQWNIQWPSAGARNYFIGANARSQPCRFLLPGAWLQLEKTKDILAVELNPFYSTLVPVRSFRTLTTSESLPGAIVTKTETRKLRKLFGMLAALDYDYNISADWWIGGSLQACWWNKAVASSTGTEQKQPLNGSPATTTSFSNNYRITDDWNYFSRFQFYINAEGFYRKKGWQAGMRLGLAATALAKQEGPANPFRLELLYRLKLYELKIR
jgi:hypothetical protein